MIQLGFIPDWQFSLNPQQNPNLNPYVGPAWTAPSQSGYAGTQISMQPAKPSENLGYHMIDWNPIYGLRDPNAGVESQAKGAGLGLLLGLGLVGFLVVSALKK